MDKALHYTSDEMVKDLLSITPILPNDSILDAGSGSRYKPWYNNIPDGHIKWECEIEDGCDFLKWKKSVSWIVGNPPYHISWLFMEKACKVATTGIAFLVSHKTLNSLFTTRRQEIVRNAGFYLQRIHIVYDKRWYGRYYYLIYTKDANELLSWRRETY